MRCSAGREPIASDGGAGNDVLVVSGANDVADSLAGGSGTDTVHGRRRPAAWRFAGFNAAAASVEAWAGNGAAVLGTTAGNTFDFSGLLRRAGSPTSTPRAADDLLIGSRFADDLRGGAGNDGLVGGLGDDRLTGVQAATSSLRQGPRSRHHHRFCRGGPTTSSWTTRCSPTSPACAPPVIRSATTWSSLQTTSDSITLSNVDMADLHQNDFTFV